MEGVILFADDKVFESGTSENKLYLKLANEFPVLAVNSIGLAIKAINSIGTFSAIILDWEFKENIHGISGTKYASVILDKSDFYSLVYVFSNGIIANHYKDKYKKKI
ncbi:MAG: hypothetical protein IPK10_15785 [Bacteroidetes bacterium]|nr:hypothetical protein [Bacteroidota bacterium]